MTNCLSNGMGSECIDLHCQPCSTVCQCCFLRPGLASCQLGCTVDQLTARVVKAAVRPIVDVAIVRWPGCLKLTAGIDVFVASIGAIVHGIDSSLTIVDDHDSTLANSLSVDEDAALVGMLYEYQCPIALPCLRIILTTLVAETDKAAAPSRRIEASIVIVLSLRIDLC